MCNPYFWDPTIQANQVLYMYLLTLVCQRNATNNHTRGIQKKYFNIKLILAIRPLRGHP